MGALTPRQHSTVGYSARRARPARARAASLALSTRRIPRQTVRLSRLCAPYSALHFWPSVHIRSESERIQTPHSGVTRMLKKLLIANRGEIAIRIARTASDLGIETVAIFADDDRQSLHTRLCDSALALGAVGVPAYLDLERIV